MKPASLKFCPRCGSIGYQYRDNKYWYCPVCLFTYYHNVAASASVILPFGDSVLMLVRNREPGIGLLALPGGFVDSRERAEEAAVRECLEETGLAVSISSFVGSWPNEYIYRNVLYHTCDLYFSAFTAVSTEGLSLDESEVSGYRLVPVGAIEEAPIAFESHRQALLAWRSRR